MSDDTGDYRILPLADQLRMAEDELLSKERDHFSMVLRAIGVREESEADRLRGEARRGFCRV